MAYSIIGIDFGTSTTVVTVKNYHDSMQRKECQPLIVDGSASIPTQVFIREDGVYFFGKEVDSELQAGCSGTAFRNFKMDLIHPDSEKRRNAQELTKAFFGYLYRQFDSQREFLHVCPETKTYISYPAKWTPDIISFMKQCAIDAGFGNAYSVFGETEPTAAIYAALTHYEEMIYESGVIAQNRPINVLMLDMGAGTSDITIFKLLVDSNNRFSIGHDGQIISHPAIDNAYLCGGREIDEVLADYNESYLQRILTGHSIPEGLLKVNREGVKEWKETSVSKRLAEDATVPIPGYLNSTLNMLSQFGMVSNTPYPAIDRGVFELLTRSHWSQLHALLSDAVSKASHVIEGVTGPESIDLAIVTGGHSQWYCVKDLLSGKSVAGLHPLPFNKLINDSKKLICESRPQETVACGLAYRDLEFDVKHTSPNSLWIKFRLQDTKGKCIPSEIFNPLVQFDTLPCKTTISWSPVIQAHTLSLSDAKLECDCLYGTDPSTAVAHSVTTYIELNTIFGVVFTFLLGGFLGGDSSYKITIKVDVNVSEDGSGFLEGEASSEYADSSYFRIDF